MKTLENQTILKKPLSLKARITNEVKSELPKLHSKYFKKFKGRHNFINTFIYVPDLINGGDADDLQSFMKSVGELNQNVSTKSIEYDLINFSFDKSMQLIFQYLFQDTDSGLCSTAWLHEIDGEWIVKKVDAFDDR
jgi:hypothetical protein